MPNPTPQNLPQHIPSALIRWQHTIRDQKSSRPRMVRNNPQARTRPLIDRMLGLNLMPGQLLSPLDQRSKKIRLKVRQHSLQHRRHPLQPHTRIDRRLRQRSQRPIAAPIKLHEHQIPNLDIPLLVQRKRLINPSLFSRLNPQVVEDLTTRPTRPRIPHLPEVILGPHPKDPLLRNANLNPKLLRLIIPRNLRIALKDRHIQPRRIDPKAMIVIRSQQLPRISDRILLEVVPKRKISQHLEEGMVTPRKPNVLQIVVLAPRSHTLLRTDRPRVIPLLVPKKNILKLIHPRIGKQQRRIVHRHQRRRVHPPMPLALKKPQKIFPNLAARTINHKHQVYQRKRISKSPHTTK